MPWTKTDYPNSMKNLDERVRNKAIEIANALLEDNYEEGRAIPIAISQAKTWAENHEGSGDSAERNLHVVTHPDGWAVRRANAERASFVFDTHDEATDKAMAMGKENGVAVILHNEDGQIQEYVKFEG